MLKHKFITIRGSRVHFIESVEDGTKKPPLLILSGWPISAHFMKPLAELLSKSNRCYILDLPGFGNSKVSGWEFFGFDFHQTIIREFQRTILKDTEMNIFGYSSGGIHAVYYAETYPLLVSKIICFSSPFSGDTYMKLQKAKRKTPYYLMNMVRTYLTNHRRSAPFLNNFPVKFVIISIFFLGKYAKLYPKLLRKGNRRILLRNIYESSKLHMKATFDMAQDLSVRNFCESCRKVLCPILLLSAQNDESVPPELSIGFVKLFPNAKFEVIPNADHAVGLTEPDKMISCIDEFLRD